MKATTVITLAATAATASAFAGPSQLHGVKVVSAGSKASSSSLHMARSDLENMQTGSTAPVPYFDPLGLANKLDDQELQKYREAEVKHGRVAMLATVGMLVQETGFHPLLLQEGKDIGPAAFHLQKVISDVPVFLWILVGLIGSTENLLIQKGWSKDNIKQEGLGAGFVANLKADYFPGDLGFDPLGLYPEESAGRTSMRNKELNNGRLAMIAIWGMWAQELVDNNTLIEHWEKFGLGPATSHF